MGQTLGIVGGVVLGQAAVAAGLVSPILIIIVALTGLGNFSIPNFSVAFGVRILRFVFFVLGVLAGFYGIAVGTFLLSGWLCSIKCFGVPFLSPMAPTAKGSSVLMADPAWHQTTRPDTINPQQRKRTQDGVRKWRMR